MVQSCADPAVLVVFGWSMVLLMVPIALLLWKRFAETAHRYVGVRSIQLLTIFGGVVNLLVVLRILAEIPCYGIIP